MRSSPAPKGLCPRARPLTVCGPPTFGTSLASPSRLLHRSRNSRSSLAQGRGPAILFLGQMTCFMAGTDWPMGPLHPFTPTGSDLSSGAGIDKTRSSHSVTHSQSPSSSVRSFVPLLPLLPLAALQQNGLHVSHNSDGPMSLGREKMRPILASLPLPQATGCPSAAPIRQLRESAYLGRRNLSNFFYKAKPRLWAID